MSEIRYLQVVSGQLTIEKLPDGSTAILDQRTKNVHSLNASATVVWEACKGGATLAEVRRALELRAGAPVNEVIAQDALAQLHHVKLIEPDAAVPELRNAARRSALLRAAAIAVPVVLTLGLSEQREFALYAASGGGNAGP
ncbi:MAG TPA: PqqD family protein [Bryobacteraceae bacterium]|nr:PqqD family protein [Bryobacteraceae bacterium]